MAIQKLLFLLLFLGLEGEFFPKAYAQEMTFFVAANGGNCSDCTWTVADGEITPETPRKFREFIAQDNPPKEIVINSLGGDLLAGLEMGTLLRDNQFNTHIGKTRTDAKSYLTPGECASAFAFMFMGGVVRQVVANGGYFIGGGKLGVHQFYVPDAPLALSAETQMIMGLVLDFTLRMGIDPRVIVVAGGSFPSDIHWFSPEELRELSLDNAASYFEGWKIEPYKNSMIFAGEYQSGSNNKKTLVLFCRENTSDWHLLISETIPTSSLEWANQFDWNAYPSYSSPFTIHINNERHVVPIQAFDFASRNGRTLTLSLKLPFNLADFTAREFEILPGTAHSYGNTFFASGRVPDAQSIRLLGRNCINR